MFILVSVKFGTFVGSILDPFHFYLFFKSQRFGLGVNVDWDNIRQHSMSKIIAFKIKHFVLRIILIR